MIVSAFLENIRTGAKGLDMPLKEALQKMQAAGMEKIYVGKDSILELGQDLFDLFEELHLPV